LPFAGLLDPSSISPGLIALLVLLVPL